MNAIMRIYLALVHALCLVVEALILAIASAPSMSPTTGGRPSPFDSLSAMAVCIGSIMAILFLGFQPTRNRMNLAYTIVLAGLTLRTLATMEWIALTIAAVYVVAVWPLTLFVYRSRHGVS